MSRRANSAESEMTVESLCVSSEEVEHQQQQNGEIWETKAMLLGGCPRCLMYVMSSEADPKCPKCKSTVLLEFIIDEANTKKPEPGTEN